MKTITDNGQDTSISQAKKQDIAVKLNKTLARTVFAHHPDCDQYDHHVLHVGSWKLCLGCTAMYSFLIVTFLVDTLLLDAILTIGFQTRYLLGLLFFIPAIVQLFWKSDIKSVKFMMRASLGVSIWWLLSAVFATPSTLWQVLSALIFILGVWQYSRAQAGKQLVECQSCRYDQNYETCLIKYAEIIEIDDIEVLADDNQVIQEIVDLQQLPGAREQMQILGIDEE